jgi:transposase
MQMQKVLYVRLDVHKVSISVTVAEDGREGVVNFIGAVPNTPVALSKLSKRLSKDGPRLEFCYEAGFCGYVIYRQLTTLGTRLHCRRNIHDPT